MPIRSRRPTRGPRTPFDHGLPIRRIPFAPFVVLAALGPLLVAIDVPQQTHALVVDLILAPSAPAPAARRPVHRIGVALTGQATLDGAFLSDDALDRELASLTTGLVLPGIVFVPDPRAAYGDVLRVLGRVRRAGLAEWQFCFGELDRHRAFDKPWRYKPMRLSIPIYPDDAIERPDPAMLRCDPSTAYPATIE